MQTYSCCVWYARNKRSLLASDGERSTPCGLSVRWQTVDWTGRRTKSERFGTRSRDFVFSSFLFGALFCSLPLLSSPPSRASLPAPCLPAACVRLLHLGRLSLGFSRMCLVEGSVLTWELTACTHCGRSAASRAGGLTGQPATLGRFDFDCV